MTDTSYEVDEAGQLKIIRGGDAEVSEQTVVTRGDKSRHKSHRFSKSQPVPMKNRLFVYGIFLGETMRNIYGMTNPKYATVSGYATIGGHIVQAVDMKSPHLSLTGLVVNVEESRWADIDSLEYGYDRKLVKIDTGEMVYMYTAPERMW
jgi:hypothetical protein